MSLYSLKLTIFQYEHCVYFLVTLLSESIAKPDRYAPRPAIICPFIGSSLQGFLLTRTIRRVDGDS